jgi:hypothetical protein
MTGTASAAGVVRAFVAENPVASSSFGTAFEGGREHYPITDVYAASAQLLVEFDHRILLCIVRPAVPRIARRRIASGRAFDSLAFDSFECAVVIAAGIEGGQTVLDVQRGAVPPLLVTGARAHD